MTMMTLFERENLRKVEFRDRGFVNVIRFSTSETTEHFLKKCRVCYALRKYRQNFITEARLMGKFNGNGRRIDVFNLTTGKEIEIETDRKRLNSKGHISILANS